MKVRRGALILRMWRSRERFLGLSHRCRHHGTAATLLLVSEEPRQKAEKKTEERREVPVFLSEAQCDSSLELWKFSQFSRSQVTHYQCTKIWNSHAVYVCVCVCESVRACVSVCVLWRLLRYHSGGA